MFRTIMDRGMFLIQIPREGVSSDPHLLSSRGEVFWVQTHEMLKLISACSEYMHTVHYMAMDYVEDYVEKANEIFVVAAEDISVNWKS